MHTWRGLNTPKLSFLMSALNSVSLRYSKGMRFAFDRDFALFHILSTICDLYIFTIYNFNNTTQCRNVNEALELPSLALLLQAPGAVPKKVETFQNVKSICQVLPHKYDINIYIYIIYIFIYIYNTLLRNQSMFCVYIKNTMCGVDMNMFCV